MELPDFIVDLLSGQVLQTVDSCVVEYEPVLQGKHGSKPLGEKNPGVHISEIKQTTDKHDDAV